MQTGLKAIDSMIPIGRGQRELIIGDRQTGKTAIAIDTIINNKDSGPRSRSTSRSASAWRRSSRSPRRCADAGALDNTIIVAAPADEAAPIKFMAPYAGCAMAEYFTLQGRARAVRSTTTSPSTRTPTARCRCCCAARRAARRTPATSSTCTPACSSAPCKLNDDAGRRLADRAADHRDAGRRRVGLHPDERDLDHRRPDLPRAEAVLLGRAPGDQRRHLGVARRRRGADHADEEGRRPPEARAVAVPRPRGVRAVRLGPRRRHPAHAGPRRAAREDAQPGRAPAARRGRPGRCTSSPRRTASSTASWPTRCRTSSTA